MKSEGMSNEVLEPLFEVAKRAAGLECKTAKETEVKNNKMCKWWTRGFCRKREKCSFLHEKGDCQEHLLGVYTIKRFNTLRHRKKCKHFSATEGCYRGKNCEYHQIEENDPMENYNKNVCMDKAVHSEKKVEVK